MWSSRFSPPRRLAIVDGDPRLVDQSITQLDRTGVQQSKKCTSICTHPPPSYNLNGEHRRRMEGKQSLERSEQLPGYQRPKIQYFGSAKEKPLPPQLRFTMGINIYGAGKFPGCGLPSTFSGCQLRLLPLLSVELILRQFFSRLSPLQWRSNAMGWAYFREATIGKPGGKRSEETVKPPRLPPVVPEPADSPSLARFNRKGSSFWHL